MPPPAKKVLNDMSFDESQEERLQRLEESNIEVVSRISGVDIRLGYVDKTLQSISDKIDEFGGKMDDLMSPILGKIEGINTRADEHSKVIGVLNEEAKAKKARWGNIKKLVYAAMLAGATLLGQQTYVWVSHFFHH